MSLKEKRSFKKHKKESKKKVKSPDLSSESDHDSEHELYYYANDRVQLMKEVLKILKSKKIKSSAPDEIKGLDIEEINTMLLEELLGISNKRLKKILEGQNADDSSSSSDEDKAIDIISLDDISDDEDFCFVDESPTEKNKKDPKNDKSKNFKKHKIKKEPKEKVAKVEKVDKTEATSSENAKLLSVLELLELQARARAIRSQLALEAENKAKENLQQAKPQSDSDEDAVIVESPKAPNEIVISSSDSENDQIKEKQVANKKKVQRIKINRSRINEDISVNKSPEIATNSENLVENEKDVEKTSGDGGKEVGEKDGNEINDDGQDVIGEIPLPKNVSGDNSIQTKEISSEKEEIRKESENVASNKVDSDNEDVINLEVVEIEGIDD